MRCRSARGDAEMLRYALAAGKPSLALLVDHDDAEREYAYASEAGTFESSESILETARRGGWLVASMQRDWRAIF